MRNKCVLKVLCANVYCCYEQGESENTEEQARTLEMTFKIFVNNNKLQLDKDSCDKQIDKEKDSRN